jgi:hypothetical protein
MRRLTIFLAVICFVTACRDGSAGGIDAVAAARLQHWTRQVQSLLQDQAALRARLGRPPKAREAAGAVAGDGTTGEVAGMRAVGRRLRAEALVAGSRQTLLDLQREIADVGARIRQEATRDETKAAALLAQEQTRVEEALGTLRRQLASAEREIAQLPSG